MPRGEGAPTPVSAYEAHSPKRIVIREERAFYSGEDIRRDPALDAATDARLYQEWYDTHKVRMPYFPAPARRHTTSARKKGQNI